MFTEDLVKGMLLLNRNKVTCSYLFKPATLTPLQGKAECQGHLGRTKLKSAKDLIWADPRWCSMAIHRNRYIFHLYSGQLLQHDRIVLKLFYPLETFPTCRESEPGYCKSQALIILKQFYGNRVVRYKPKA